MNPDNSYVVKHGNFDAPLVIDQELPIATKLVLGQQVQTLTCKTADFCLLKQ